MNKKVFIVLGMISLNLISCSKSNLSEFEFENFDARKKLCLDLNKLKEKEKETLSEFNSLIKFKYNVNNEYNEIRAITKGNIYSNNVSSTNIEVIGSSAYYINKYVNAIIDEKYYSYSSIKNEVNILEGSNNDLNLSYSQSLDLKYEFLNFEKRTTIDFLESILLLNSSKIFKFDTYDKSSNNDYYYLINNDNYSNYKINKSSKIKKNNNTYLLTLDLNSNLYIENDLLSNYDINYTYSFINENDSLDSNNVNFSFIYEGNNYYSRKDCDEETLKIFY